MSLASDARYESNRLDRMEARAPRVHALARRVDAVLSQCRRLGMREDVARLELLSMAVGWNCDHGSEMDEHNEAEVRRLIQTSEARCAEARRSA